MRLLFKQRMFSWLGTYDIFDDEQKTVYTVKGQLAWTKKLHVYTVYGEHVAHLVQRAFSFRPKFDIYIGGELVGTVSKELTLFNTKFTMDPNGWSVEGEFWKREYTIMDCAMNTVATVSKKYALTDTYAIDVVSEENALLALLLVLTIDVERASNRND
jgi:uncharacterized protein YxjI